LESAAVPIAASDPEGAGAGQKGLKTGALSWVSNLVIGVASTAPGYSLAATLGFVVAVHGMGFHAPAVMIVSFIPMVEFINEHPHEALITAAKKHNARMIVVGSHGESPLGGAIIGATPYKLVQLSETPVLVVRP
jgi:hypothetical protein